MTVEEIQGEVSGRVEALINKMSASMSSECDRLGCHSVLGDASGARLVYPGKYLSPDFLFERSVN